MEMKAFVLLAILLRISVDANVGTRRNNERISRYTEQIPRNELFLSKWRSSPFSDRNEEDCRNELQRLLQEDETCEDSTSFEFISYGDNLRTCDWLKKGNKKRQKRKQTVYCPRVIDEVRISDQCKQTCKLCSTCSYRCSQRKYIASDVCEHSTMCSECAKIKPLHKTCRKLWARCSDSENAPIYAGLDCSVVKDLHKCYMENIEEDYRETLVKYNWSWVEQPKLLEYKPGPKTGRYDWFLTRKPFEPIVNDTTAIAGVLYTFSESVLKMSVFFPPLYPNELTRVQIKVEGEESEQIYVDECDILPFIWMCTFRLNDLPMEESYKYKVKYSSSPKSADLVYEYKGLIPLQVGKPRIATMSCLGARDTIDANKVVEGVLKSQPDFIALLGDHNYFHHQVSFGFLETIYFINKLTKSLPTIVQLDDHDYGLGNIFGAGTDGECNSGDGFIGSDPCLFQSYEYQALSHLPDPASAKTLINGINYQYTNLIYGDLDIAILEARKFKNKRNSLLGLDQEQWLQDWCENESNIDRTKIVLAQTPFISFATHYRGQNNEFWTTVTERNKDSNGFPPKARKRALEILQGCTNLVISGDQHIGFAVEYPEYEITDCAAPATYNSVFWRTNENAIGGTYIDSYGNQYTLKEVYHMPQDIRTMTPASTVHSSAEIYSARGDGFLVVDFTNGTASCEMKGYESIYDGSTNDSRWRTDIVLSH
ncbi:hypothetical protein CTEN210_18438 [Chaetoceros tenuissimus]|uniref:PhoD-like phosphatase metallophosphatase domain-containing protein n=1 Tax=Chaetoceros tenuissimus TaxID=426638 RepID=A0AAD3DCG0_9STRA|nr:hypothetical protein CTEN210_18438 [Chaetoceros tenuissimus]